jgi:hypothetical protein
MIKYGKIMAIFLLRVVVATLMPYMGYIHFKNSSGMWKGMVEWVKK